MIRHATMVSIFYALQATVKNVYNYTDALSLIPILGLKDSKFVRVTEPRLLMTVKELIGIVEILMENQC
jgi:hypothetical protein